MSGPLKDTRHEAFCRSVVKLDSDLEAYRKAYKCSKTEANRNAWRLRGYEGIKKRVMELQLQSARGTVMTIQERREISTKIARDEDVEPAIRLRATEVEAKHAGEYLDRQDLTTNGESLPTALPQIIINPPGAGYNRRGKKA